MGVIPREKLTKSTAPFADAASAMWGEWAGIVIAVAAIISSLGALNGWTLMLGQVPMAAARDGAMPSGLRRRSPRAGVPARGLVISVGLSTLLVVLEVSGIGRDGRLLQPDRAALDGRGDDPVRVLLGRRGRTVRHAAAALARAARSARSCPLSLVAFVFSIGTIYGSGATAGMWALILILLAAPVWVFLVGAHPAEETKHESARRSFGGRQAAHRAWSAGPGSRTSA